MAIQVGTEQEGSVAKVVKTPKIIPPKSVKPIKFKSTARPQQNLRDVSTGPIVKSKIGDSRKIKTNETFLPVRFEKSTVKFKDPNTGFDLEEERSVPKAKTVFDTTIEKAPAKKLAAKLFYTVQSAKTKEQAKEAYANLNEYGKKAFWSYAVANKKLVDPNISDDYKADRSKYAGSEYFDNKTDIVRKVTAETNKQIDIKRIADEKTVVKPMAEKPIHTPQQKILPRPIGSSRKQTQGMTQSTPESIAQSETNAKQLANTEINRVISTPQTGLQNFARGGVSGLTAGLSEAGMTTEQKLAYMKAMAAREQAMRTSRRGEAIQEQSTEGPSAYGAGQLVGSIAGGLAGEVGLRGGVLAGETLGKQVARGAVIGGTQQGVMSTSQGKSAVDIAKDVAIGVGLGAIADVGLNKLIGSIGKKYAGRTMTPELEQVIRTETADEIQKIKINPNTKRFKSSEMVVGENGYSTIRPKPLKTSGGVETPTIGKNATKTTTEPITNVDEAIAYTKSKISTKPLALKKKGSLYQDIFSTQAPIEDIGRLKLQGAKKVAQQAQNLSQSGGTVDYILGKDLVNASGERLGKGLNDSLKDLSAKEQSDVWDMMLHEHNIDRMKQDKPVFGERVPSETSAEVVKQYATNPKIKQARDDIRKIIDTVTDEFAVKSGLVSKETIDNIRQNIYKAYIPTYRQMDQETLQLVKSAGGKLFKKATGSSKDLLPPEQQVAAYINKVVRASRKNEMYNGLLDLVTKNPDELSSFAQLSKTAEKNLKADTGDFLNDAIDSMENNAKKIGDKYQFTLYKNGEPVTLDVSEPMYKALNSAVDDSALTQVGEAVRKYATGPMKALITGYNPLFAVTNYMRDLPTALLYSTDAPRWVKNYPKAMKEIASNGELWKQYQALGGTRSGLFSYEKGVTLPANRNIAQNIGKGAVDTVGAIGNVTEVLPRFTEYLATIEKMGNDLDGRIAGIANAAEITTNFARSGKLTKQLDAFVPYLNPAVQGIDRFFRAARYNPIKTIAKGVGLMTVPSMILESINSKDPAFKEINQRTKDANYLVPMGEGKYFKVPKSRENALVFATMFEWLSRAQKGEKIDMEQAINTIKTNLSPGDPVNSFVGTPLMKAYKQLTNPDDAVKNYANMDIVPQNLRGVDAKYQYDVTTRQLSKAVGEQLNVSPKVIDYLIDSYTGVVGQATRPSTTKTGAFSTLGNKFIADAVTQNDNINKLYNISTKLAKVANTRNLVEKIPGKVVTPEDARKNYATKQLSIISDLRKEQKAVESENLTLAEKKAKSREIQNKMNEIARNAISKLEPNKKP